MDTDRRKEIGKNKIIEQEKVRDLYFKNIFEEVLKVMRTW